MHRILFIRTNLPNSFQATAIDHYALEAGSRFEVHLLGSVPQAEKFASLSYLSDYPQRKINVRIIDLAYSLLKAAFIARRLKPHFIHIKNHRAAGMLARMLRLFSPKSILFLDIRTLYTTEKAHRTMKLKMKKLTALFDHIFVLNDDVAREYVGESKSSSVLPIGYDPGVFYPSRKTRVISKKEKLRFIYYGSMNKQRQLNTLVDALIFALERGVQLEANFYGEGDAKAGLIRMVPEKYSGFIHFADPVSPGVLNDLMQEHHVGLAYVPNTELLGPNMALKTVEMIAAGIYVLASDTEGNRVVMEKYSNGVLVADNSEAIGKAIIQLFQNGFKFKNEANVVRSWQWKFLFENYLLPVYQRFMQ